LSKVDGKPPTAGPDGSSDLGHFEQEAGDVLRRVCRAIGQVIEQLPGPIRRAADVQRALGVDKALGWQLFRVGSGSDPINAGPHLPRPAPLAKALRAAARCGVSTETIDEASDAAAEFERLVERHAGHRGAFDAMARAIATGNDEQVHLKDRRAAFRANSNIWGINALASYSCLVYHDGEHAGTEDSVLVVGQVGLHKLRPSAKFSVGYQWSVYKSTGGVNDTRTRVAAQREVEFLEAFSTSPLPVLRTREVEAGVMEATLELRGVGRSSAVTYFTRHIARAASEHSTPSWYGGNMTCRIPVELCISDILVPRGWCDPTTASVSVYGNLQDVRRVGARDPADRLPCAGVLAHLGQDIGRLQTPVVPRCPEMIADVVRGMGWEGETYDVFRCAVEYPILLAGVATRVDAASAPH
jgi:hypothetical protein